MTDKPMTLSFKCPNPECGTVFTQPLSWFKDTKSMECPACHHEFVVDFEKLPELQAYAKLIRES
jgi:hypothetical protein